MESKYNRFTFCPDDYMEKEEDGEMELQAYAMYEDLKKFIILALKNGYQCRVFDDGYAVCVDYNYKDEAISGVGLEWVGEDEYVEKYKNGDNK